MFPTECDSRLQHREKSVEPQRWGEILGGLFSAFIYLSFYVWVCKKMVQCAKFRLLRNEKLDGKNGSEDERANG